MNINEKTRFLDQAKDKLIVSASILTQYTDSKALALAMINVSHALWLMAQTDEDNSSYRIMMDYLDDQKAKG